MAIWKMPKATTALMSAVLVAAGLILGGLARPAPAGAAASPIVVGLIGGFTGPLAASVYATPPAMKAWVSYVNAHGGISGRKVQLIIKDDQTNPETSQTDISQLIGDNPLVIFDESDFDSNWAAQVAAAHIPVIPTNSSTVGALESSNFFTAGPTIDTLPQAIAAAAKKIRASQWGCSTAPSRWIARSS
jgi:ABC-type branched-subunit amino acid transport system substrate-binding protein